MHFLTSFFTLFALIPGSTSNKCINDVQSSISEQISSPETDARIETFPYMASFGKFRGPDWINICAASVLSENVLLTAAHCFKKRDLTNFQVLLGQSNLNSQLEQSTRQLIDISKVEQHPKYDNVSCYFDIGLIYTAKPIVFNDAVKPLCLPEKRSDIMHGLSTSLAGWGATSERNRKELILRDINLAIYSKEKCNKKYDITGIKNIPSSKM